MGFPTLAEKNTKYFKKVIQVLESVADTEHVQPFFSGLPREEIRK